MRMEADKLPECGNTARQLGARQGKDIPVCANGKVDPTTGGMSVAAGSQMSWLRIEGRPCSRVRGRTLFLLFILTDFLLVLLFASRVSQEAIIL
jgi:hypothetical protein